MNYFEAYMEYQATVKTIRRAIENSNIKTLEEVMQIITQNPLEDD